MTADRYKPKTPLLKPRALRRGDKIGIVAPASNIQQELLEAGAARLRSMGYETVYSPGILERDLYFAGPLERRVAEMGEMLERDDIAAILCARGGYGCNYLLNQIDFQKFAAHPKIFMGYSDNTSLLTAVSDACRLVTFHGPMVTKDFAVADCVELSSFQNAVSGVSGWNIPAAGVEVLREGHAQGRLYGGCLSMLAASLGTPYEMDSEGSLLFMEDIAAKPYQIDRMLMQLEFAGKLQQVKGMIFGEMVDCAQPGGQDYTLQQVILRVLSKYDVPIVYGLKSGHVSSGNITLPLGVQAELKASRNGVELNILEAATTA
jgi:muramoyltetrapeptide carboxypeptidase